MMTITVIKVEYFSEKQLDYNILCYPYMFFFLFLYAGMLEGHLATYKKHK